MFSFYFTRYLVSLTKIDDNQEQLDWFNQFGNSIHQICLNVNEFRHNLMFGFGELSFSEYGWINKPLFLDREEIILGNAAKYFEHSVLYIGRGANDIWTYGMMFTFGLAGGSYGLSVFGRQFQSRDEALSAGLKTLKDMMTDKLGSADSSNHKQAIIKLTLDSIAKYEMSRVQLRLF